jgi:molecular chaperone DnaK (HSP70)
LSDPQYIIGIDLGTTHCVLAYTQAHLPEEGEPAPIEVFQVPQIVNPGEVKPQPMLPSFLLLPGPHDVPPGSMALPWASDVEYVCGEFARKRGSEIPNRLVSSAKSWLSYAGVDRTEALLPLDAPADVSKISPVEASARYLEHLREAWNDVMAREDPAARFENQDIYLTVPASFDAVARELTVKAARSAGLISLSLLEEPQAAFYAWIEANRDGWRNAVRVGESILVCDVGGGTTDLSLIQVTEENGDLALRRAAVGDHILLGGDNMDLTLAYAVRAKLAARGTKLDNWQFRSLWHTCRVAKERLLANPDLATEPVVILGRGSSLIGATIRTELSREEVQNVLLDGFFPEVDPSDYPGEKPKVGMREIGLPYETDPAVTKHLAKFLGRQAQSDAADSQSDVQYPGAVLFNGGVMKPELIRHRLLSVLDRWNGGRGLRQLGSPDLDLAVARGAAYYGLARKGRGIRIRGGIGRPYYIGVESAMPAVPGVPAPIKALCVAPFGMEEGTEAEIRNKEFGLVVGEPAVFSLLASTVRKKDQIGEIVEDWAGEIEEVTTMEVSLPAAPGEEGGNVIPVWLQSMATEVGTLELWCVSRDEEHRWKLEFNLRERAQDG